LVLAHADPVPHPQALDRFAPLVITAASLWMNAGAEFCSAAALTLKPEA
jgi:hypothetical protein